MLANLPKLIGRGFVLGFLLPATLFCLYLQFQGIVLTSTQSFDEQLDISKLTPIIFFSLVVAVLLMALNRGIIRILEGYGRLNPFSFLTPWRKRLYARDVEPLYAEAQRVERARSENPTVQPNILGFRAKLSNAVDAYPDQQELVLPTRFGNAMRAFEIYSRVLYGLDAIPAWPRLFMILPQSVQNQVRDSRAMLDFNANLFVLSLIAAALTIFHIYFAGPPPHVWLALLGLGITATYAWMALPGYARQWGDIIKSSFDLYRDRLAKQLGLAIPSSSEVERQMWRQVSRAMVFRSSAAIDMLDRFKRPKTHSKN